MRDKIKKWSNLTQQPVVKNESDFKIRFVQQKYSQNTCLLCKSINGITNETKDRLSFSMWHEIEQIYFQCSILTSLYSFFSISIQCIHIYMRAELEFYLFSSILKLRGIFDFVYDFHIF